MGIVNSQNTTNFALTCLHTFSEMQCLAAKRFTGIPINLINQITTWD